MILPPHSVHRRSDLTHHQWIMRIGSHANGITNETDRATLRAQLDGMIAPLAAA
jgi:hypothetical protein